MMVGQSFRCQPVMCEGLWRREGLQYIRITCGSKCRGYWLSILRVGWLGAGACWILHWQTFIVLRQLSAGRQVLASCIVCSAEAPWRGYAWGRVAVEHAGRRRFPEDALLVGLHRAGPLLPDEDWCYWRVETHGAGAIQRTCTHARCMCSPTQKTQLRSTRTFRHSLFRQVEKKHDSAGLSCAL